MLHATLLSRFFRRRAGNLAKPALSLDFIASIAAIRSKSRFLHCRRFLLGSRSFRKFSHEREKERGEERRGGEAESTLDVRICGISLRETTIAARSCGLLERKHRVQSRYVIRRDSAGSLPFIQRVSPLAICPREAVGKVARDPVFSPQSRARIAKCSETGANVESSRRESRWKKVKRRAVFLAARTELAAKTRYSEERNGRPVTRMDVSSFPLDCREDFSNQRESTTELLRCFPRRLVNC